MCKSFIFLSTTSFRVFLGLPLCLDALDFQSNTFSPDHRYPFTGSTVALHCGKDHVQSQQEKGEFWPRMTSKSLIFFQIWTWWPWLRPEIYTNANFHFNPFSGGFFPDLKTCPYHCNLFLCTIFAISSILNHCLNSMQEDSNDNNNNTTSTAACITTIKTTTAAAAATTTTRGLCLSRQFPCSL